MLSYRIKIRSYEFLKYPIKFSISFRILFTIIYSCNLNLKYCLQLIRTKVCVGTCMRGCFWPTIMCAWYGCVRMCSGLISLVQVENLWPLNAFRPVVIVIRWFEPPISPMGSSQLFGTMICAPFNQLLRYKPDIALQ